MKNCLCVYCTRTHQTEHIMERIAERLDAELVRVTDGKDRGGVLGYIGAAIAAMRKKPPELKEVKTEKPISEYGTVILGMPIWAETTCPIAKAFLQKYGRSIRGDVAFVVTHLSDNDYDRPIAQLDAYLNRPHKAHLSLSTRGENLTAQIDAFLSGLDEKHTEKA